MIANLSGDLLERTAAFFKDTENIDDLNKLLKEKTGIIKFFSINQELKKFKAFLELNKTGSGKDRDLGDFQTPKHLTDLICQSLLDMGLRPSFLIEPTCGTGNFVLSDRKSVV